MEVIDALNKSKTGCLRLVRQVKAQKKTEQSRAREDRPQAKMDLTREEKQVWHEGEKRLPPAERTFR